MKWLSNTLHLFAVVTLSFTASASGAVQSSIDSGAEELVKEIAQTQLLAGIHPALVRVAQLDLAVLACPALRVEVLDRVPTNELIFVKVDNEWELSLFNKELAGKWKDIAAVCLRPVARDACSIKAENLAWDLAAYFVDPNRQYGVVLLSAESVPTDYNSSDILHDLRRAGLDPGAIRRILVPKSLSAIRAPEIVCTDRSAKLTFVTWDYFGGEVVSWRIALSRKISVRRKVLATRVGSFDDYF